MNEHLITTNVEGKKVLRALESFEIDYQLAKHKDRAQGYVANTPQQGIWLTTNGISSGGNTGFVITGSSAEVYGRPSVLRAIWELITRRQTAVVQWYKNQTALPVTKVFEAVMGGGKKLVNLTNRLDDYAKSIQYAKSMGQVALAEQLTERLPIIEAEAVLVSAKFDQMIEEELLIQFALKCEKGLCLDWVKNFTRLIPHSAQVKKIKLDQLRIFDNYLVLHFDPNQKATAMTKKEIEKKKDPILFGVIKGSRRLYKVADWKDEFCDLTFGDLIEQHGKEALTLN